MMKSYLQSTQGSVILAALIVSFSILLSNGVIKIKGIGPSKSAVGVNTVQVPQPAQQAPEEPTGPVQVSVDDDPLLGDKNAPVTLIEFSDYECPFCKRHFDQVYPELKKNYIDKGKVKLVFRDLPLSFHEPMATTEAIAANCSREQGGDNTYFKYHDELFKRTKSNGNGLTKDDLWKVAADLGLNSDDLKSCVEAEKFKDEVGKDLADGGKVGASGTPTFFIGKSDASGTIEGKKIVGAQPYAAFQSVIDALLQ